MKLRFEVDQAECFRRGIDCPKSIVTIEVDPSKLKQEHRNLIADRLMGIDVCQLRTTDNGMEKRLVSAEHNPIRVIASGPSFDLLMMAVIEDQNEKARCEVAAIQLTVSQMAEDGELPEFSRGCGKQPPAT